MGNGAETNINYILIYLYFSWNTKKINNNK